MLFSLVANILTAKMRTNKMGMIMKDREEKLLAQIARDFGIEKIEQYCRDRLKYNRDSDINFVLKFKTCPSIVFRGYECLIRIRSKYLQDVAKAS